MRPVTASFLRVVTGSHSMAARARVVTSFQRGTNPAGTEIPIVSGEVTLDASAQIRGTLDLTTDGNTMWPTSAADLLTPYGNELFVERGVVSPAGTASALPGGQPSIEWVSQGYYRITTVEQQQVPNGPIRIGARDRMAGLVDARLLTPIQYPIGTSVEDVFDDLVLAVYPGATIVYDFNATNVTFPVAHIAEQDRYGFLADIVRSLGKVWFWDHQGDLRIESAPDPEDPVVDINAGDGGVLVEMSRALDRDGVYNAVVAAGEQPSDSVDPVRAVARDMSPSSPTYWLGTFGQVPRFYSSPFITTSEQARTAAAAMLTKSIGLPYNVDFRAVPNPALEPLDPVRIRYSYSRPAELHVLDKLTIPLTAESSMGASTREQTSTLVEVT